MKRLISVIAAIIFLSGCATKPSSTWMYQGQPATAEQIAQSKQECGWKADIHTGKNKKSHTEINHQMMQFKQCMVKEGFYIKTTSGSRQDVNTNIARFVSKEQLYLPLPLGNFIRVDELKSGDKKLLGKYTILDQQVTRLPLSPKTFTIRLKPGLQRMFCPFLIRQRPLSDQIESINEFRDLQGKDVVSVTITSADCQ
ncbi:hypothetical protein [Vibrio mangrovi]|uniref:Lipoprotein n=1 Tax=Vibrio mangrovi TaxID=474394 RepID=A0A1Y6IQN0_9VIBR|nr:hypothetical protein [Vibrio mangrovi]MDW6003253.1 hypothetical protein [Vibrio mangrovi]SMR99959.1 hypothetical protein VIM7927_01197 [Vibrio mangrovi]